VVLDLFNREVVGWSLKPRMTADIVCDALTMTRGIMPERWKTKNSGNLSFHDRSACSPPITVPGQSTQVRRLRYHAASSNAMTSA
jgi:transposase InsO family protein